MCENTNILGRSFDNVDVNSGFSNDPLPDGTYLFKFVKYHVKNSDGTPRINPNSGIQSIDVELAVVEPVKYAKRRAFIQFRMFNGNPKMVAYAEADFGRMNIAAGLVDRKDWGVPMSTYGLEVMGDLVNAEFEGKTHHECTKWYPPHSRPAVVSESNGAQRNPNNAPAARPAARPAPARSAPSRTAPARQPAQQAAQQGYQQPATQSNVAAQQPHVNADPFAMEDLDDDVPF